VFRGVILSPSLVILSAAKDRVIMLRLNSAKNLAIERINDLRDPSSPSAPQDDTHWAFFSNLLEPLTRRV
jgi:hypothetical protein